MSEEQGSVEVSKQILKEEKKQNRKEGIQTVGIIIMATCMVIITIVAVSVFLNINRKINAFYQKADTAITSLNEIATDIQEADLPGMAERIDSLTTEATDGIATTMEKIDSLDIDTLNESIANLQAATAAFQATVEGFASIFGH